MKITVKIGGVMVVGCVEWLGGNEVENWLMKLPGLWGRKTPECVWVVSWPLSRELEREQE